MKKLIYAVLLLVSSSVMAEGPYDGIWSSDAGFFSAHENDGTVVVVRLLSDRSEWEALVGQREGDNLRLETISGLSGVSAVINVTFTSDTSFNARQESCHSVEEGSFCALPNGVTFSGNKIW